MSSRFLLPLIAATAAVFSPRSSSAQQVMTTELVDNFDSPLQVVSPTGDFDRIFVVEQDGIVRVVKNGTTLTTPFLDITSRTNEFREQGLLGVAFHPSYAENGWIFVHYTNLSGNTRLDRFTVDASDPDVIDINSRVNLLKVNQPYVNHNGGMLAFGEDGYLYLALGDGGSSGDPGNRSQDGQTLLGKMLRLDVSVAPYLIPVDNPFVGDPNVRDEIWSIGLRNPWRFSFDRVTGDMWIGDVGQNDYEEINFEFAGDGGLNYGWRIMEGGHCFNPSSGCNQAGLVFPIQEYAQRGNPRPCSVTGGYVYRGESMATMHGRYFYADYCSGQTWSFRRDAQRMVTDFVEHTSELKSGSIASFGEDANGELYLCMLEGPVYRIVPDGMRLQSERLIAGNSSQIELSGAAPSGTAYLTYSVVGLGSTSVPQLGVTSNLKAPRLLTPIAVDSSGSGSVTGFVPGRAAGVTIWAQALAPGVVSNVLTQLID
ncbi:MAG: PQQ-dependent sugar dehydrogenase [Planctomycetes bacterium]|nr:PQQ-dependent sugar dehydrogenase [Planctomycetota bacterium]